MHLSVVVLRFSSYPAPGTLRTLLSARIVVPPSVCKDCGLARGGVFFSAPEVHLKGLIDIDVELLIDIDVPTVLDEVVISTAGSKFS